MEFAADAPDAATGGEVTLFINDRRSARAAWTTPSRSASPATPAWTSAATTAGWSIASYEEQQAVRVHRHDQEGGLRHQATPDRRGRARATRGCPPRPSSPRSVGVISGRRANATRGPLFRRIEDRPPDHRPLGPNSDEHDVREPPPQGRGITATILGWDATSIFDPP